MTVIKKPKVAFFGNPNCGKTTLFNQITGLNNKTGNWGGVTVDSQSAAVKIDEQKSYELIDLPGIYALSVVGVGQDEVHVQKLLLKDPPDVIINVINSASMERGLFLTVELMEYGVPIITVLNMWDEATVKGLQIDADKLAETLNTPVVSMVATTGHGLQQLKKLIGEFVESPPAQKTYKTGYSDELGFKLDENSEISIVKQIKEHLSTLSDEQQNELNEGLFSRRFEAAYGISQAVMSREEVAKAKISKLDRITTHPFTGSIVFFFAMYVMFFFAINLSGVFVDFFDIASQAVFIDGGHWLFEKLSLPPWLAAILADGVGGGLQTVATFIPVIGFLYLILTWFEDSGYMSRAAFVMNALMQKIGLSGQSFVPLIVSFGCNVPAIAATRALPSRREKLITIMMAPFMSCGARLSVYALFVAAFFVDNSALIVFSLYFFGIVMAVLTGVLLKKTLLPGKPEPFLIELTPWRIPTFKNLIRGTWLRLKGFLKDAGKIIVVMVMLIQILSSLGSDGSWGNQDTENSVLSSTAKVMVPVFEPMGIEEKNWPAVVGILTGVLAKEVVVGTLDAIYTQLQEETQTEEEPETSVAEGLKQAVMSIKDNALDLGNQILDPLGWSLAKTGEAEDMAERQEVNQSVFGIIYSKFGSSWTAYAYLLFILLYFPCVAATAAIAREAGMKWAVFSAFWSTGLAYVIATCFYQAGQLATQTSFASKWIVGCVIVLVMVYLSLKQWANVKKT